MEESHYRALLDEVRSDIAGADQAIDDAHQAIADAEQSKKELATLEEYLVAKVEGGGTKAKSSNSKSSAKRASTTRKAAPVVEEEDSGKGMQTVEFGPDGFPST